MSVIFQTRFSPRSHAWIFLILHTKMRPVEQVIQVFFYFWYFTKLLLGNQFCSSLGVIFILLEINFDSNSALTVSLPSLHNQWLLLQKGGNLFPWDIFMLSRSMQCNIYSLLGNSKVKSHFKVIKCMSMDPLFLPGPCRVHAIAFACRLYKDQVGEPVICSERNSF